MDEKSFNRGQKDVLNRLWESKYAARFHNMTVEINTVDAFQGRETDIVFYSVVRSNDKGSLGFLKDKSVVIISPWIKSSGLNNQILYYD